MSGPYDAYGGPAYNPPQGMNQYPYGAPPQQGYPPSHPYGGGYPSQDFGPPQRQDSFGPPQHGGFQHGQAGSQFGAYDASNPQGHSGYYGGPPPPSHPHQQQQQQQGGGPANPGYDAYLENQRYQQSLHQAATTQPPQASPYDAQAAQNHEFQAQSSDPNAPNFDPNAPPMNETDRGLLGAFGGGVAGHFLGKKANHGFLGTVGGGILGSLAEDFFKDKRRPSPSRTGHHHHHHHSGGSHHGSQSSGQNSWGGGSKW